MRRKRAAAAVLAAGLLACGPAVRPAAAADPAITGDLSLPRWDWKVFGPVDREAPVPETAVLKTVPAALQVGTNTLPIKPVNVEDRFGRYNLASLLGGTAIGRTAYVFIPFRAPADMEATLGFGADWWFQAWLDGEPILDTMAEGNGSWPPTIQDHQTTVSLAKGPHVLAVRFVSGSGSSILAVGGPNELRLGPPPYPLSLFANTPMPPGNLIANGGFEDGAPATPFVPAGWINGPGRRAFRGAELTVQTNLPIYGQRSLELNTLSGGAEKRLLLAPFRADVDTCYEITFKACHLAGEGYASVSVRNDAAGGFHTGFVRGIGVDRSCDRYNQAIKKGTLGAARAYYFFDTPAPCLVIQAHGPVHAVLDDVCIVPVERSKMWNTWSEQRAPTRLDWQTLSDAVVTPHTAWAKPLAGGALRVLSLMPRRSQRLAVELAQRIDMTCTPVFFEWGRGPYSPNTLGFDYWVYDADGDPRLFLKEPDTLARLAQPADCIVMAGLDAAACTPPVAAAILRRVEEGVGLVIAAAPRLLAGFTNAPWAAALSGPRRTEPRPDLIALQADASAPPPDAVPAFYQVGRGRIAVWPVTLGDGRVALETQLPALLKAMRWAAGREPAVRIGAVTVPGTPRGTLAAAVRRESLPARVTVALAADGDLPRGVTVRAWVDDFKGEPPVDLGAVSPGGAAPQAAFELPPLPAGKHGIHVQVRRGGRVEDWTTAWLEVAAGAGIEGIALDRANRLFAAGEPVTGRVTLNAPLPPDRRLAITLADADGRIWATNAWTGGGAEFAFSLPTDPAVVLWHTVKAEIRDAAGCVARAETPLSVTRPPAWYAGFFDFQLWCIPNDNEAATRALRRLGVTSDYHGFLCANHARNNIRGGPTAGLHYELTNRPGVFFPHHKTELRGDLAHAPIRYPCLNDPDYQAQMTNQIEKDVGPLIRYAPQAYSLAHEWNYRAYGSLEGPVDTCFCPHCLASFRRFARAEHGTLDRLNAAWGSAFTNWDDVAPLVLADALQARQVPRWIDHRRHADQVFADFFKIKLAALRRLDPAAEGGGINLRVGLTTLDSYSGVDFWKLYHEAGIFSYLENPYVPAFTPRDSARRRLLAQIEPMWFPDRFPADERLYRLRAGNRPWLALLAGARGFAYYEEYFFMPPYTPFQPILNADLTASETIQTLAGAVSRIRAGLGHFLFESRPADSGIALLYSRASEHAATAWQALQTNRLAANISPPRQMGFYTQGLQALGFQFAPVSDDQVAGGILADGGYRLLILPVAQALSTGTVARIRDFVRDGGCLAADLRPAMGDVHGTAGTAGLLDDVFGVRHAPGVADYEPAADMIEPGAPGGDGLALGDQPVSVLCGPPLEPAGARAWGRGRDTGRPAFLTHRFGKGRAILWNGIAPDPDAPGLRLLRATLAEAGLRPLFDIAWPDGQHAAPAPEPGDTGTNAPADAQGFIAGGRAPAQPIRIDFVSGRIHAFGFWQPARRGIGSERLVITPPAAGHLYDLKSNAYLGRHERLAVTLPLEDTALLASVPFRIGAPRLTLAPAVSPAGLAAIRCRAALDPDEAARENLVVAFRLVAPDGAEWPDFAVTRTARAGVAEHLFVLPVNAPRGRWRVEAREAISGLTDERHLVL